MGSSLELKKTISGKKESIYLTDRPPGSARCRAEREKLKIFPGSRTYKPINQRLPGFRKNRKPENEKNYKAEF
jgi:hypothetical protein